MFENKEYCVINGPSEHPKQELEKKVVEFGGTIVQNPGECHLSFQPVLHSWYSRSCVMCHSSQCSTAGIAGAVSFAIPASAPQLV